MIHVAPGAPPILSRLARTAVGNHIRLSVPWPLRRRASELLLQEQHQSVPLTRSVVVVVGAGASYDAIGLPLAPSLAQTLRARLGIPQRNLESEIRRLKMQYRLEPGDFETQMLAMSRFEPADTVNHLVRLLGRRFYVAQLYEYAAHLLKHRFVDAIVSFNFDEVLDQAIHDELGRENYWRVVSDADLPRSPYDRHGRLRLPLYVKPHGTTSHASSLRFTREEYFRLPDGIVSLLTRCLTSNPTTLVTVGFGLQSAEFYDILRRASEQRGGDLEVVAFDPDSGVLNRLPPEVPGGQRIHCDPGPDPVSMLFPMWWREIENCFVGARNLRGVERHTLLAELFPERPVLERAEDERGVELENYLWDRMLVEMVLAVAKAKGFINIGQLLESRTGTYFREFLEVSGNRRERLHDVCEKLSLDRVDYSRDTVRLRVGVGEDAAPNRLIVGREQWAHAKAALADSLCNHFASPRRQEWASTPEGRRLLDEALDQLYAGHEVEVFSPQTPRHELVFKAATTLHSMAALRVQTLSLLQQDWDTLLCVAESGEWLEDDPAASILSSRPGRSIAIIVADETFREPLSDRFKLRNVTLRIATLPWWLHNQHMTIALKNGDPIEAIYFERRLRSLVINPVVLTDVSDLKAVEAAFLAYWVKARGPQVPYLSNRDLERARRDVFSNQGGKQSRRRAD